MAIYYVRSGGDIGSFIGSYSSEAALRAAQTLINGDVIYFANDHSTETYSTTTTFLDPATPANNQLIYRYSVNPLTMALTAGAREATTTATLEYRGGSYNYGLTLEVGAGQSASYYLYIGSGGNGSGRSAEVFEKCTLKLGTTNISARIAPAGDVRGACSVVLNNCTAHFSNASQAIVPSGPLKINGLSFAGTQIISLFKTTQTNSGSVEISNSDLSTFTNFVDIGSQCSIKFKVTNCKPPTNWYTGTLALGNVEIEAFASGTDDHNYQYTFISASGQINQNTGVYLTNGGASFTDTNGALVPLSLQVISSANASKAFPLKTPWFNVEVPSTGSKTFSVKIANTVAALKDTEVWLELEYMADSANPMTTNVIDAPVVSGTNSLDILAAGTNRTDTAEAWTGITGEITHTLSKTVTVNQIGWARARVCLAKASTTIYVDPQATVA